jgi:hypothetical protein
VVSTSVPIGSDRAAWTAKQAAAGSSADGRLHSQVDELQIDRRRDGQLNSTRIRSRSCFSEPAERSVERDAVSNGLCGQARMAGASAVNSDLIELAGTTPSGSPIGAVAVSRDDQFSARGNARIHRQRVQRRDELVLGDPAALFTSLVR